MEIYFKNNYPGKLNWVYGVGIPRNLDYSPAAMTDSTGYIAFYSMMYSPYNDCPPMSMFLIKSDYPGSYVHLLYLRLEKINDLMKNIVTMSISNSASEMDKIGGTSTNKLIQLELPH